MTQPQSEGPGGHDAVVTRKRGVGFVWLIPIVAAAIGAWLAVDAIRSRGPTFTVTFETAEGLVAGKTMIKYKAVDVGSVESIRISDDLSHVIVTCAGERHHARGLTE